MAEKKRSTSPASGRYGLREGRSLRVAVYNLDTARRHLEQMRRAGDRRGVTVWRQTLTISAAAQRAQAGDRTAARRLAWRTLVLRERRGAEWLVSRVKALDAALARLRREPSHPDCAACYQRQERTRGQREEFLAEIAALPHDRPTYARFRRLMETEATRWLRTQLDSLDGGRA